MVVEICIIDYIKTNYMFRPFSLAIFRLIIEKLSKKLHHATYITHARSHSHSTSYLPTVYNPHKSSVAAY